jgi:hypothetical protein
MEGTIAGLSAALTKGRTAICHNASDTSLWRQVSLSSVFGPSLSYDSAVISAGVAVQWTSRSRLMSGNMANLAGTAMTPTASQAVSASVSERF